MAFIRCSGGGGSKVVTGTCTPSSSGSTQTITLSGTFKNLLVVKSGNADSVKVDNVSLSFTALFNYSGIGMFISQNTGNYVNPVLTFADASSTGWKSAFTYVAW